MEQEYKWILDNDEKRKDIIDSIFVSKFIKNKLEINMKAIYYDDIYGTMKNVHGALRKRKQNEECICCLKIEQKSENNCKKRMEYELKENDIYKALKRFPDIGAPKELCDKIGKEKLNELCTIEFDRIAYRLQIKDNCILELSFDNGEMIKENNKQKFMEMELELKSGDENEFHTYANMLENKFALKNQPLSKIARAMSLDKRGDGNV